eukprot:scaffold196388_cov15-Tisochrysis_lutea.AAC.1
MGCSNLASGSRSTCLDVLAGGVAVYKAVRAIADIPVNLVKEWTQTLPKTLLEGCSKVRKT